MKTLPETFSLCEDKWKLVDCKLCDGLGSNLVCTATSEIFGAVVLKVEGPHESRHTEAAALEAYDGCHACRLLDVHGEAEALLLERIVPGKILKAFSDKSYRARVGCELVASLPVSPPDATIFPSYADWIQLAFGRARKDYNPGELMVGLMSDAELYFEEIQSNSPPQVLLHGDLHHENIVQGPGDTWKVIDPQGVIGPACLECARFIQNHVSIPDTDPDELDSDLLAKTVAQFADSLGETTRTIAHCVFVLDVLSTAWGYEMNYSPSHIDARIRYSQAISEYIARL